MWEKAKQHTWQGFPHFYVIFLFVLFSIWNEIIYYFLSLSLYYCYEFYVQKRYPFIINTTSITTSRMWSQQSHTTQCAKPISVSDLIFTFFWFSIFSLSSAHSHREHMNPLNLHFDVVYCYLLNFHLFIHAQIYKSTLIHYFPKLLSMLTKIAYCTLYKMYM